MDSDGTNQTRLTFEIGENRLPAWSPNGRQIAFENGSVGGIDLFMMDADGNNQRRLTNQRDDDATDRDAHEWNPWLSVPPKQEIRLKTWGAVKRVKQ